MHDLDNDILYPFFLDVGRPVVSYIEDLATLPMYLWLTVDTKEA